MAGDSHAIPGSVFDVELGAVLPSVPSKMDQAAADRMSADWDARAHDDAHYFVAFGRRKQDPDEFLASAADVVRLLEVELKRRSPEFWCTHRALEIGCGPGRLMHHLHKHFQELHGVDISQAMIEVARTYLPSVENVKLHHTSHSDLREFSDHTFALVYSYAVFQHIPDKEVIWNYLREALRVLLPGGLLVFQVSALAETGHDRTTWEGARVSAEEVSDFARENGLLLLALNNPGTQYLWVTIEKPVSSSGTVDISRCWIKSIINPYSRENPVPSETRFGAASIGMQDFPEECDLLNVTVRVDGKPAPGCYVSPVINGLRNFNVILPAGTRTGLVPIEVEWRGKPLCPVSWARVIPAGPRVPRICALTDGANLLSSDLIDTGDGKLVMEEIIHPDLVRVKIDEHDALRVEPFCVDPLHERYDFNFGIPAEIAPGDHTVTVSLGERTFAPIPISVGSK